MKYKQRQYRPYNNKATFSVTDVFPGDMIVISRDRDDPTFPFIVIPGLRKTINKEKIVLTVISAEDISEKTFGMRTLMYVKFCVTGVPGQPGLYQFKLNHSMLLADYFRVFEVYRDGELIWKHESFHKVLERKVESRIAPE